MLWRVASSACNAMKASTRRLRSTSGTIPARCLRLRSGAGGRLSTIDIYSEPFLIERPLLAALRAPDSTALLIDEIDRFDQEFEAFLLEFLSDASRSPDSGARHDPALLERPVVVLHFEPHTRPARRRSGAAASITGSTIRNAEREARISDAALFERCGGDGARRGRRGPASFPGVSL